MKTIHIDSADKMQEFGDRIATNAKPGYVIALNGDLGAGKTTMSQGIAKGLGITEEITSPTFTIVHQYDSPKMPFYHMDVYRIKHPDELYEIGFEEYVYGHGLTVIEWAELITDAMPDEYLEIRLYLAHTGRRLELIPYGNEYELFAEELISFDDSWN